MTRKFPLSFKVASLILSFALISICVVFLTETRPRPSEHSSVAAKQAIATSAPPLNERSDNLTEPLITASNEDPYAWFRSAIEANARKKGMSLTESAIDQINADKITKGTAEGTYNCVMQAFWNEPEVFLDSLKATAQGMELKFAIAAYLCKAGNEKSFDHFAKAYNTINPGGARLAVVDSWVRVVGCEQGIDAAITIITGFDFREEKVGAILALKQVIRQNGLEPSAEQGKQLEEIKRSK